MLPERSYTALILAGSRRGEDDPVARYRGAAHKCLVEADGVPLLVRVVDALVASARVGSILVLLDDPRLADGLPQLARLRAEGRLRVLPSAPSLARSVMRALAAVGPPLLVTTGDHPLLTPSMVGHFLDAADASGAEVAVGLTSASMIRARYPGSERTYLRFRGGAYSGANLFALRDGPAARRAAGFWRRVERDRKRPWRLARALGPALLLAYLSRLLTLPQVVAAASRRLGVRVAAVPLPFAEAAIDVDKPSDLDLVEAILASRRSCA
jgi:CTP:molybdopterin cytidylyltransferase MocA